MKRNEKNKTERGAGHPAPSPSPIEGSGSVIRVRMLRPAGTSRGSYQPGTVIDLPADTARSWIAAGIAEQDKMIDGPPEIKMA